MSYPQHLQQLTLSELHQEAAKYGIKNPPASRTQCREIILAHCNTQNVPMDVDSTLEKRIPNQPPGSTATDSTSHGQAQQSIPGIPPQPSSSSSELAQLCAMFSQQQRIQQEHMAQQQRMMQQLLTSSSLDKRTDLDRRRDLYFPDHQYSVLTFRIPKLLRFRQATQ